MEEKKSYLTKALEHHRKQLPMEDNIQEYSNVMQGDILSEIWRVINQDKDCPLYLSKKDFYIVIMWQRRRVGWALGYPTISRISCPTPTPQQSVWRYHQLSGHLEFMWSLPSQQQIDDYVVNKSKWLDIKDHASSCKFAVLYKNGKLLEWAKKANGELPDGILRKTEPVEKKIILEGT